MEIQNLAENTILYRKYRINKVLGFGGFGITYLSRDLLADSLVVIKEYFPQTIVTRNTATGGKSPVLPKEPEEKKLYLKGKKDFLEEARRMSKLFDVQAIVKVLDYFEENDTVYIVMEYVQGISLEEYMERREIPMDFKEAWELMEPVVNALEIVHKKGMIHRDLNPSNLIVTEEMRLKVIDFGAARKYLDNEKTMTILVKRGYAPPEQYSKKGRQGPWTDVYAVCATIYEMVTGVRPEPSIDRLLKDELYLPSSYGTDITPEEEMALAKGLEPDCRRRTAGMKTLCNEVRGKKEERLPGKRSKIYLTVLIVMSAGIACGVWRWQNGKRKDTVVYAGNYVRDTKEYKKFVAYTKKNAVSLEAQEPVGQYDMEKWGSILYTLPSDAVKKWGHPCNAVRFHVTREEFLKSFETSGYETKKVNENEENTVEVRKFGAILTWFGRNELYEIKSGPKFVIQSDSVNGDILNVLLYPDNGETDHYADIWFDLMKSLDKEVLEDREKAVETFKKAKEETYSRSNPKMAEIYEADSGRLRSRWYQSKDGKYGCCFLPAAEESSEYYWP